MRPGEKLYEELLIGNNPQKTQHPKIMKASEEYLPWDVIISSLIKLKVAIEDNNVLMIRSIFKDLIPEYTPEKKLLIGSIMNLQIKLDKYR